MITAQNISFSYPGEKESALLNLNFKVGKAKIICLVGGNGSGKSTLLCLLAGLFSGFKGTLSIAGLDLATEQKAVRKLGALVPQSPDLFLLGSTLREDMFLGIEAKNPDKQALAISLCTELGLVGVEDKPIQTLSFGQRRKASIASALMQTPKLLLLDEPFSGLDFEAQLHLRNIIKESQDQSITQIIVAHDLDLIADLADSFILLEKGQIVMEGEAENVFPHLRNANVRPPCCWLNGATKPAFIYAKKD